MTPFSSQQTEGNEGNEEGRLKANKAIFEKGAIKPSEEPVEQRLSDDTDDPWLGILNEQTPRPAFQKFVDECQKEIKQGNSRPLNVDNMN